jgi:UDP-glucose 4-epimerase
MKVLVTGASGAVGPALVNILLQKSYAVRILTRTAPPLNLFPKAVEYFPGDICDQRTALSALEGIDIVYHLAAKLHLNTPCRDLQPAYQRVNVGGTQNLVQAAQSLGVSRFVFFSTISVYGPSRTHAVFDETSPLGPQSLYAVSKSEAEKIVLSARRRDQAEPLGTVLRLATVYGSRMKGNFVALVKTLHSGRFIPIGAGQNRRTLVYDYDAARAAVLAASHPLAAGQVFNVTDGRIHAFSDILAAICEVCGRRTPKLSLPATPVRLAVGLIESCLNLFGIDSPIKRTHVDKLIEDVAVSGERIQKLLGFQPCYDLVHGWQETIQHLL